MILATHGILKKIQIASLGYVQYSQLVGATDGGSGTINFTNGIPNGGNGFANTGGTADLKMGGVGSYLEFTIPSTQADGSLVAVIVGKNDDAEYTWNTIGGSDNHFKVYPSGNDLVIEGSPLTERVIPGLTLAPNNIIRIVRSGTNDLTIYRSSDSGATFTSIITYSGCIDGATFATQTIRVVNIYSGTNKKVQALRVYTT